MEFLVPKATPEEDKLVWFHLSIPMGYVESAALFCATTKTVKGRTHDTLSTRHTAPPHHLENLADTKPPQTSTEEVAATLEANSNWEALSPHTWATSLSHKEVYLDDFIGIVQGRLDEKIQMTRHFFCAIDKVFWPSTKGNTAQEEPISLKNLCKGNDIWST